MRKEIYLAITNRIKAKGLIIKHFDLWNENIFQAITTGKPFPTPAIFIEFEPFDWKQAGQRVKHADVYIKLHIVTVSRGETRVGCHTLESELKYLDLVEDITSVLPGLSGSCFNALVHTGTVPNHNHENLVDNIERFKTHVTDRGAMKYLNTVQTTAQPVIKEKK